MKNSALNENRKGKLTENEIKILKTIYFNEVDYNKIKITRKHLFSYFLKNFSGITFGNKIIFSKKAYKNDFSERTRDMAILVHEVCHVWQKQNVKYWWFKAMTEHLKFGKSVYKYGINEFDKLTDYRFEQQGEILSDYYKYRLAGNIKAEKYEEVIYGVIHKS